MYQPKTILVILDGWGYSTVEKGNAIFEAKKPNYDYLWQNYPHALIDASGAGAGLPWGSIGGSEVGHMSIGAGRVLYQDLPRISRAINSGWFFYNKVFLEALEHTRKNNSSLHLIGLVSAAGVHSHINHLFALLDLIHRQKFKGKTFIHMITDGRDTPSKSAPIYLEKVQQKIASLKINAQIASISGRYFAMDRDSHWERTFAAYNAMVNGRGQRAMSASEAIQNAYHRGQTDEFIEPTNIYGVTQNKADIFSSLFSGSKNEAKSSDQPQPVGLIYDNDAIIFFNFRFERMTQLVETFLFKQKNYPGKYILKNLYAASIVEYEKTLPMHVALPSEEIVNPLAKVLSDNHLTQLHMGETEKYNHVTYFFDGENPTPFPGEDWLMLPSPRVATYDLKPEMSAPKITKKLFEVLEKHKYDVVIINFANADMVGHTGNFKATIKAVEAIDNQIGEITKKLPDSTMIITADHGNAEEMINPQTGEYNTEHSVSPVPVLLIGPDFRSENPVSNLERPIGILGDLAPSILEILKIRQPEEMTGYSLISSLK